MLSNCRRVWSILVARRTLAADGRRRVYPGVLMRHRQNGCRPMLHQVRGAPLNRASEMKLGRASSRHSRSKFGQASRPLGKDWKPETVAIYSHMRAECVSVKWYMRYLNASRLAASSGGNPGSQILDQLKFSFPFMPSLCSPMISIACASSNSSGFIQS